MSPPDKGNECDGYRSVLLSSRTCVGQVVLESVNRLNARAIHWRQEQYENIKTFSTAQVSKHLLPFGNRVDLIDLAAMVHMRRCRSCVSRWPSLIVALWLGNLARGGCDGFSGQGSSNAENVGGSSMGRWQRGRSPDVLHRPSISKMMEYVNRNEPFVMKGWLEAQSAWEPAAVAGDFGVAALVEELLGVNTVIAVRKMRRVYCNMSPRVVDTPEVFEDELMTVAEYLGRRHRRQRPRDESSLGRAGPTPTGHGDSDPQQFLNERASKNGTKQVVKMDGDEAVVAGAAGGAMNAQQKRQQFDQNPQFDPSIAVGRDDCMSWKYIYYVAQQSIVQFPKLAQVIPDVFEGAATKGSPFLYLNCPSQPDEFARTMLHWDFAENMHFVLAGRKKIVLWDAVTGASLFYGDMKHLGNRSPIDIYQDPHTLNVEFPAFKLAEALAWQVTLDPGDALYIPMCVRHIACEQPLRYLTGINSVPWP